MRKCTKCYVEQPLENFYRTARKNETRSHKCKECTKFDVSKNRADKMDYYREYDKSRAMNPDRVAARNAYQKTEAGIVSTKKAKAKYVELNRDKIRKLTKDYRKNHPNKSKAHGKVAYAVKMGDLTRGACEVCGELKAHGHHDDYSKPLDVRWLCSQCHSDWHKENGEGLNA